MYTFNANKSFGQLLDISPIKLMFLKIFNSEFLFIEAWLNDQISEPPEIDDKTNETLVIN